MSVLVIGGGIVGLSIAWRLAQSGLRVRVADAGHRGGEASPAGAGMLAPGGEYPHDSVWARMALESYRMYRSFVDELSKESGVPIDYGVCGTLELARTDEDWAALRQRAAEQRTLGIASEERAEGIFYRDEGYVDPRDTVKALLKACSARDVEVLPRCIVAEFDTEQASAVVLSAGAWSNLVRLLRSGKPIELPPAVPVKGHLIGFQLAPGSLGNIRRYKETYIVQRGTGFTIAGSTQERAGFDATVDENICRDIHKRAAAIWPELADKTPVECWTGLRPGTEDGEPRLGNIAGTNVWLAYGHFRNGILLAPATAARLAREITSSVGTD